MAAFTRPLGRISRVLGKIDSIVLDREMIGSMRASARLAGASAIAAGSGREYAMGLLQGTGRAALRAGLVGGALGAIHGAVDNEQSVIGGAIGGALSFGAVAGVYGMGRSGLAYARALRMSRNL